MSVGRWSAREYHEPVETWLEMKGEFRKKYFSSTFSDRLLDQQSNLKQRNISETEYICKFDEFIVRYDIQEDSRLTLS